MHRSRQTTATVMATLLVTWLVATTAAFGGTVAADQHTQDEAPDMSEYVNYTINLPHPSDHYPGDQNAENASIEYFATGEQGYHEMDAEEGIWMDIIVIDVDWIDYSACDTENTAVFGIDRGNNNSGTQIDEDLVQYRQDSTFRDDGLDVHFYDWEDFANNPPYLAPEDAVVSAQGAGSNGGPCLTMTEEPGWYQVQTFFNGTVAEEDCTDSGNDACEPEDKEYVGAHISSNYIYICECDSEAEAREQLGAPPDEDTDETPTPTEEDTPEEETETPEEETETPEEETETPEEETETPEPETPTPTETIEEEPDDGDGDGDTDTTGDDADGADGDGETGGQEDDDELTPTPGDGPGFTGLAALLALLAAALFARRR